MALKPSTRRGAGTLTRFARVGFSIAILTVLLHQVDLRNISERLGDFSFIALGTLLAAIIVQFVLSGWRWQYILRRMGVHTSRLWPLLHAIGKGYFYGQLLPSSVGVDVIRTMVVTRAVGLRMATTSVVIDRLSGLCVLAAWAAVTLPLVAERLGVAWPAVFLIEGLLIVGGAGGALLLRTGFRSRGLAHLLPGRLRELSAEAVDLVMKPATIFTLTLTSAAMHAATIGQFYAIAWGLGLPLDFGQCLLLLPAALLLAALPISFSGWGVREGGVVVALAVVGIPAGAALTASILFGLVALALGLATVGGGFIGEWLAPLVRKYLSRSTAEILHD